MFIKPIKTRPFLPPKDDLFELIKTKLTGPASVKAMAGKSDPVNLKEGSILVITSKIISIGQGRCIKLEDVADKDELIKKEAEFYLPREKVPKGWVMLTMKHNIMIPTAGIDESNANGYYILWPEKPFETARKIYAFIKREYKLKKFGIIISDSHTVPLRYGTMGIALAYWGFWPLNDYRRTKDIFGREMLITQQNIADSLATAAVLAIGEGKEQTPLAIIEDVGNVRFTTFDFRKENPLSIPKEIDIYGPLLNAMEWEKGGK